MSAGDERECDGGGALGIARIALGVVFVVRTTALANLLPIPLAHVRGPLFGWPEPSWPFAWWGAALPDGVREVLCVVRTAAAIAFLLGVRARVAGIVAGACGLIALSQDPFGFIFTLHTLFLGTIVLALTSGTEHLALVRSGRVESADDVSSSLRLVWVLVATVYVAAAIAKLHTEWLSGGTLLALADDFLLSPSVAALLREHPGLRVATAVAVPVAELALPAALFFARTRAWALVGALVFHLLLEIATHPDVIGWVMGALLLAFLPASAMRRMPARDRTRVAG